jgi:hypothetical protein
MSFYSIEAMKINMSLLELRPLIQLTISLVKMDNLKAIIYCSRMKVIR